VSVLAEKTPAGMRYTFDPPELVYVLAGPPVPWKRTQTNGRQRFTDPRARAAQHSHRWLAGIVLRCAVRAGLDWDDEDTSAEYEIEVTAYCATRTRGDWDNLAKIVGDSIQGVVFPNDKQITDGIGRVRYDREKPRTEVRIRRLPQTEQPAPKRRPARRKVAI
jgi:Holliday junction resolvase RusA-like endonuclease